MTTCPRWLRTASALHTLVIAAIAAAMLTTPASAQSESDLRRENQELATKVRDLEAELDAARKQVENLQRQVAALQQQLSAARSGSGSAQTPLEEPKTTIDESKPDASPRALTNAIVESYKKAVGDAPVGQPGDRDRIAYMRVLEKWRAGAEREFRAPISWVVRAVTDSPIDNPAQNIYTFMAVDPVTDAMLGQEFNVQLSRSLAARMADLASRGELGPLVMKGTLVPSININPDRATRGAFDNPTFVGPFVEYQFTVQPSSITPHEPAPQEPAATQP